MTNEMRAGLFVAKSLFLGGFDGVSEEEGDGDGSNPAGDGGDLSGDVDGFVESDVADGAGFGLAVGAGFGDAVDADVDDQGAGSDVFGADEARFADGDNEDFGPAGVFGEVAGGDVASGNGGHLLKEKQGYRPADDGPLSDDDGFRPADGDAAVLDDLGDGECGTGGDDGLAVEDESDVGGVDAFDVFVRIDAVLSGRGGEVVGQGHVQHDAGDGGVIVESVEVFAEGVLGDVFGELVEFVLDGDLGAEVGLGLGVKASGRGIADEDGFELEGMALVGEGFGFARDLFADLLGDELSIEDGRGHEASVVPTG